MYAILDIETTGGKYNKEGITEIAIHRFDGHEVVDRFISLVNPEKEIQPFVVKLTGINNNMLRTAPKFHEIAKRIVEITQDTILVAHNAQFDYRILRTEFRRLGYNYERKTLCTVDLSKMLFPKAESYSLGKLVRSLGIPVSDRHRANGDALATLELFKLLLAKDTEKNILQETIRKETQGELTEKQLDTVRRMPNETGVFYMHDKDGAIIYLSKSTIIKKRVNQQFTKSGNRARKLVKETKKVSYEKTGSAMVAHIKEYQELLKNKPKYNKLPKKRMFTHTLSITETDKGLYAINIIPIEEKWCTWGRYNGFQSALSHLHKLSKEFNLSNKISNVNNTVLLEPDNAIPINDVNAYNERVVSALSKYSITRKNMLLIDKGRNIGEQSVIQVLDGIPVGLGYFKLNHQINNIHILESILTPLDKSENIAYIVETYLRKNKLIKKMPLTP